SPDPPGGHLGAAVGGDDLAHDARGGARRVARGLRAHGARQGCGRDLGARPARAAQRVHSDPHPARTAVGPAHGRRRADRDGFRVAGARPAHGQGDLRARLHPAAGRGAGLRARVHRDQPPRRSLVRRPRSAHRTPGMTAWRRFLRNRLAVVGLALIVLLVLSAALAPWLAPYDPTRQSLIEKRAKPGAKYWLGADEFGRDILSRVIYGSGGGVPGGVAGVAVGRGGRRAPRRG